jgi:ribonuclease P protein component
MQAVSERGRTVRQPQGAVDSSRGSGHPPVKPFARDSRLRRQHDLDYVKACGKTAVGTCCVVTTAPAKDGRRRISIVISRYFSLKAVERNRARRLLREALRQLFPSLETVWFTVRPRQRIKGVKLEAVMQDLKRLLERLEVLDRRPGGEH